MTPYVLKGLVPQGFSGAGSHGVDMPLSETKHSIFFPTLRIWVLLNRATDIQPTSIVVLPDSSHSS